MMGSFEWGAVESVLKFLVEIVQLFAGVWVFTWVSILIHELGHLVAGKLMGMHVVEIRVGQGRPFPTFRTGHIQWRLATIPLGGWVVGFPEGSRFFRLRECVFTLGGPVASASLLAVLLWLSSPGHHGWKLSEAVDRLLPMLCYMETAVVFMTLWPSKFQMYGREVESDGALLIRTLTGKWKVSDVILSGWLWRATRAIEEGRQDDAIKLLRKSAEEANGDVRFELEIGLAFHLSESNEQEEACMIFRRLLAGMDDGNPRFPEVVDAFASTALYQHYPELFAECESMLRRAIARWPDAKTLKGTLGSILIEQGATEEGREMIRELYEARPSRMDIGISAAYLSVLEAREGNHEKAATYREEARTHLPSHRLLDRLLGTVQAQSSVVSQGS